jgi:hypothetical protein
MGAGNKETQNEKITSIRNYRSIISIFLSIMYSKAFVSLFKQVYMNIRARGPGSWSGITYTRDNSGLRRQTQEDRGGR